MARFPGNTRHHGHNISAREAELPGNICRYILNNGNIRSKSPAIRQGQYMAGYSETSIVLPRHGSRIHRMVMPLTFHPGLSTTKIEPLNLMG